jgi:hypothetical protein
MNDYSDIEGLFLSDDRKTYTVLTRGGGKKSIPLTEGKKLAKILNDKKNEREKAMRDEGVEPEKAERVINNYQARLALAVSDVKKKSGPF